MKTPRIESITSEQMQEYEDSLDAFESKHDEMIAFVSDIVGHDKETIEQMYNDWKESRNLTIASKEGAA